MPRGGACDSKEAISLVKGVLSAIHGLPTVPDEEGRVRRPDDICPCDLPVLCDEAHSGRPCHALLGSKLCQSGGETILNPSIWIRPASLCAISSMALPTAPRESGRQLRGPSVGRRAGS